MVTIVASSTTISYATLSRARTAHRFGSRVSANASVVVSVELIKRSFRLCSRGPHIVALARSDRIPEFLSP